MSEHTGEVKFRTHQILRSASLGTGAYGCVYKAKCDNLLCAAKIVHRLLVFSDGEHQLHPERRHRLPMRRFQSECRLLSAIRHPNIVQYLGTCEDSESDIPEAVLLMELMDGNLTGFLEDCEQPLPFHNQVNICHDISLALSFLHSNGIFHRDLSSNNILMLGDRRAKITDFGMARLFSNGRVVSLTERPGTEVYMPPEALEDESNYNITIDCFSYGVLVVQIISLVYPKPGNRFVPVEGGLHKKVPEFQRRQAHIELIEPKHPLLPVALDCLKDESGERPSAESICKRMEEMIRSVKFSESKRVNDPVRENRELKETLETLKLQHKEEISSLESRHLDEIRNLQEQRRKDIQDLQEAHERKTEDSKAVHKAEVDQLQQLIKTAEEHMKFVQHNHQHSIMELTQDHTLHLKSVEEDKEEWRQRYKFAIHDMREKDDELRKLQKEMKQLRENVVSAKVADGQEDAELSKRSSFIINWQQRERPALQPLYREDSETVFCNETLYVRPALRRSILAYSPKSDIWEEMPKCPHKNSTLARLDSTLLALGGRTDKSEYLNKIYYLTNEGGTCRWEEAGFRMPSRRCSVVAVNTSTSLVVAGGEGVESRLRKVEVMDISTRTWLIATELPEALIFSSATVCRGDIFFLGGETGYNGVEKNSMFTCSIEDLHGSRTNKVVTRDRKRRTEVWRKIVGPPVTQSACVSFRGQVLSIGGRGNDLKPTSAVYSYNSKTSMWHQEAVSYMTLTRSKCFALPLYEDKILVVGGNTHSGKTDTLEIGTLLQ